MSGLFVKEDFISHSGLALHWKIECDALSDSEVECLVLMLSEVLPPFASVRGIPRGGLRLAEALVPFRTTGVYAAHLIVDDVLTTGRSMEEERARKHGIGAVLFARGPCPAWITPLFQMASRP